MRDYATDDRVRRLEALQAGHELSFGQTLRAVVWFGCGLYLVLMCVVLAQG